MANSVFVSSVEGPIVMDTATKPSSLSSPYTLWPKLDAQLPDYFVDRESIEYRSVIFSLFSRDRPDLEGYYSADSLVMNRTADVL